MAFGYEVLNGGDSFRALAAERNLSVAEFTAVAESDPDIDRELDRRLEAAIDAHLAGERDPTGEGLLVESRGFLHHNGSRFHGLWYNITKDIHVNVYLSRAQLWFRQRSVSRADTVGVGRTVEEPQLPQEMCSVPPETLPNRVPAVNGDRFAAADWAWSVLAIA